MRIYISIFHKLSRLVFSRNKVFGFMVMGLSLLVGAQIFAQTATPHLRERVFYVDATGIVGQTDDVQAQIGDSAAYNFAWGMKKIVVHEGKFYHVFTDRSEGGDHDVYLRLSTDGIQWGNKIRVSDDSLDAQQHFPTIAVHGSGSNIRIVAA